MFNRPNERRELLHHIQLGRSILMLAPRRIGKTWLMKKIAEDLRANGWMTVLCDVEGIAGPTAFLSHVCEKIQEQESAVGKVTGRAKQMLNQILAKDIATDWKAAVLTLDWPSFAETLVRGLHENGQKTVILVDELALFINDLVQREPATAQNFLYRLRALDQAYPNVRWLFTGSIGLDAIAKRAGIGGALLDLKLFPIEPFSTDAAREFLDHLSINGRVLRPFTLDAAVFARLIEQLGWLSPYYLELIAHEVRPSGPAGADRRAVATEQDIDSAFQSMLDRHHRNYFVAWEEHLTKNFNSQEAATMRRILNACVEQPTGETLDTLTAKFSGPPDRIVLRILRDFLSILVADGYLLEVEEPASNRYRFRSGLLRRYWQRYHAE